MSYPFATHASETGPGGTHISQGKGMIHRVLPQDAGPTIAFLILVRSVTQYGRVQEKFSV